MKKLSSFSSENITRRSLLKGLVAAPFLAPSAWASIPTNPDVVVVGAGAAGLAAAKTLSDLNISYVLVEAQGQIGGRAYTDNYFFGVPYDMGCHWLHNGDRNPWQEWGRRNGFTIYIDPLRERIFVGNREATRAEYKEVYIARERVKLAIGRAGRKSKDDISPAQAIKIDSPWTYLALIELSPWDMGKDIDDYSCLDWFDSDGGDDWFCKEGFGTMVAYYARKLPVKLGTPVHHIDWQGPGVKIETSEGTISSKVVIITASTGVLAAEKIKFTPSLPVKKQESFNYVSMGIYNHIALQFSKDIFEAGDDGYISYIGGIDKATGMITNMSGTNLSFNYVGGSFGRQLELDGINAAVDYGLQEIVNVHGSDVKKYFIKGNYTRWGEHPWTIGSYASTKPGYYHMREELALPLSDKLFFAGEACHPRMWATCGGARLNGEEVAGKVAKILKKK